MASRPIIVVQGGAGAYATLINEESKHVYERGVVEAAKAGYSLLTTGGSAVDAVEAAVAYMEDSPQFNAGRGSYLTSACEIEMDASIMEGEQLKAGAVSCIKRVANPVKVARLVMDKTDHVMFTGEGGQKIVQELGIESVDDTYLMTEKAKEKLKKHPSFNPAAHAMFHERGLESDVKRLSVYGDEHDTVGAVALDGAGNVACATSTGGVTAKKSGRVGDSPIIGSGGYADNLTGAVSTTGHGESFMKMCTAKQVCFLLQTGVPVSEAVRIAIDEMKARVGGVGGCVAIDRQGNTGVYFNTEGMSWASVRDNTIHFGILEGENKIEEM